MRYLITSILLIFALSGNSQTGIFNIIKARQSLELAGYKLTGVDSDTALASNSIMKIPTTYAVVQYVANHSSVLVLGGSSGQVQYNNGGVLGALDSFTVRANPDRVGFGVPVPQARVDIMGSNTSSSTNALRIRNSSGTGILTLSNDSQVQVLSNTEASKPSLILNGTGFSGGTSTTTKPTLLIEPTGTTSTGWSTSGTKLGINAESGFTGNLLDLKLNGVNRFYITSAGQVNASLNITSLSYILGTVVYGGSFRPSGAGENILFSSDGTFSMAQFGGTTSLFPSLKRVGTDLQVRLADDSGFAASQNLYNRVGSGSPEGVVTAPIGAVYHRTDGGANTTLYVKESGTGNTGWIAK